MAEKLSEFCYCRCHGVDTPLAADAIASVFACTKCRPLHDAARARQTPPLLEKKPFDPESPSQQGDGWNGN